MMSNADETVEFFCCSSVGEENTEQLCVALFVEIKFVT